VNEPAIWIAVTASLIGCYFAACNVALKSFSRSRLAELLEAAGRGRRFEPFVAQVDRLLIVTGIVRTGLSLIVLLAMLYFVQTRWNHWLPLVQYAVAFVAAGTLVSVFAVAVPVSWARYHRERLLTLSITPLQWTLWGLYPLVGLLHLLDPVVRRLSGSTRDPGGESDLSDEVLSVVEDHEHAATVDEAQKEMIEAVFEFPTRTAGEIMTPRTDVAGLEVEATLEQIKAAILDEGHSRIPVYEESLDHIVGVLYAKDLIRYLGQPPEAASDGRKFDLRKLLREPYMVPESKSVRELLAEFKQRKVHMAIVLDEYGGTAGLVTIEDILEELVGEIRDEYEPGEAEPAMRAVGQGVYEVDARVDVDELHDELSLPLPEDRDYDTVGGFVFSRLGHIPVVGEQFEHEGFRFTVLAAERTRVRKVRIELLASESQTAAAKSAGDHDQQTM
jgi:CBS domain containing-hemolysin-like protein